MRRPRSRVALRRTSGEARGMRHGDQHDHRALQEHEVEHDGVELGEQGGLEGSEHHCPSFACRIHSAISSSSSFVSPSADSSSIASKARLGDPRK